MKLQFRHKDELAKWEVDEVASCRNSLAPPKPYPIIYFSPKVRFQVPAARPRGYEAVCWVRVLFFVAENNE